MMNRKVLGVLSVLGLGVIILGFENPAHSGFEVGNGRQLIKNDPGNYKLMIPERLEVGFADRLTEIISPFAEGTPRARLQINVVKNVPVDSHSDLVASNPEWTPITLAGLHGIRKEIILPTKLHQIEVRLFVKTNEMIIINLEGTPTGSAASSLFGGMEESLGTFELLK